MYISRINLLSEAFEPKQEVKDPNIVKEALKSKQIKMGSQIHRQGQLLSAVLFEAFPFFQCLRILVNAANICKILLGKFHVRQMD